MAAPMGKGRFVKILPKFDSKSGVLEPIGRSGHTTVSDEGNLYVYGGYNPHKGPLIHDAGPNQPFIPARQVMAELWVFNFATRKWRKVETPGIPQASASSCMKICRRMLYVYGGTQYPFGHIMSNKLSVCHIDEKFKWENIIVTNDVTQTPPEAYGQSLFLYENEIFVFGGAISFYTDPVSDLHKLDMNTKAWERVVSSGSVPCGRYKQEIVIEPKKDRFIVIGGGHLSGAEPLNELHAFNFTTKMWSLLSTSPDSYHGYPIPRSCFGCVQYGQHIIICGGRHYITEDLVNEGLDDIWWLNLDSLQWTKLDISLPTPTFFHGTSITPTGCLYIFGGIANGEERVADLYKFQIFMPKLAELAWEAFVMNAGDLEYISHQKLLELGVPISFVKRMPPE